ncbi:hypothetical protein CsSME_00010633 [Camellia sinensis var. sinensis]
MADFSSPYRTRKLDIMNCNDGYAVINRALTCGSDHPSSHRLPPPSGMFNGNRMTTNVAAAKSRRMFDAREMKRKKRVAKYKWYAVEGKVKASLKKGYRWFKRRCSEIVRGF